jgi:hypothetical protein
VPLSNGKVVRSCDWCARHLSYARQALEDGDMETAAEVTARLQARQAGDTRESQDDDEEDDDGEGSSGDNDDDDDGRVSSSHEDHEEEAEEESGNIKGDTSKKSGALGKGFDHNLTSWLKENKGGKGVNQPEIETSEIENDEELENTVRRLRDQLHIKQLQVL